MTLLKWTWIKMQLCRIWFGYCVLCREKLPKIGSNPHLIKMAELQMFDTLNKTISNFSVGRFQFALELWVFVVVVSRWMPQCCLYFWFLPDGPHRTQIIRVDWRPLCGSGSLSFSALYFLFTTYFLIKDCLLDWSDFQMVESQIRNLFQWHIMYIALKISVLKIFCLKSYTKWGIKL